MKKMLKTAVALVLSACLLAGSALAATPTFSDVPSTFWGYSFITRAAQEGLVSGVGNGKYDVNGSLSNAAFTTMVCNLFYKDEVNTYQNTYKPSYWWQSYMAVAYTNGLLSNTAVGENRQLSGAWSTQAVNASMSRYDMAQVMMNVAKDQGWSSASALELLAAQAKIADWSSIPTKYQNAVASAYAKGFLSGMDNNKFEGAQAMTRAHGAVVVCKLLDAKDNEVSNVYTNTTKLVNGKAVTETNVENALATLKREFPNKSSWDTTKTYESKVLGSAYGDDAFAYTMSDRVFGAIDYEEGEADSLKAGDVVYLSDKRVYVIVQEVDGDEFYYAYCSSNGLISWGNSYDIDDLDSKDDILTRYGTTGDKLSNGKSITETNVEDLIKDFQDEEYDEGDKWDMDKNYKSTAFYKNNVKGNRAFAYYVSDYIFGDELDAEELDDFDDVRAGDVIYLDDYDGYEGYVIVTEVDDDEIHFGYVTSNGKVRWDNDPIDIDDLTSDDAIYTRYVDDDKGKDKDDKDDDTLSNGKSVTAKNVKALLDDFQDEEYDDGDEWDMDDNYKSTYFYKNNVKGSRAFAYYVSDYVFDELEVDSLDDFDDVRVGDVVCIYNDDDDDDYYVVVSVDGTELTCVGVNSKGKVDWDYELDVDDLESEDEIYTRYLSDEDEDDNDGKLSNGKVASSKNVKALIEDFRDEEYDDGDEWDMDETHKFSSFSKSNVKGSRAFAYYLSEYIFEDLDVESLDDPADVQIGDVIELWDEEVWVVVTNVDDDEIDYITVDEDGEVYSDWMEIDDLDADEDFAYTRYPA